jgi:hypothetical protein
MKICLRPSRANPWTYQIFIYCSQSRLSSLIGVNRKSSYLVIGYQLLVKKQQHSGGSSGFLSETNCVILY